MLAMAALLAVPLFSAPAVDGASGDRRGCSGLYNCLGVKPGACDDASCLKNPAISYDDEFCNIFRRLQGLGMPADSFWGQRIFACLSGRYRVVYEVKGSLPFSDAVMAYLLDHLSFSAQLINAYRKTDFTVEYLDAGRKRFKGDNGKNLSGAFQHVLATPGRNGNVYFGYGISKILMWKLWGEALVLLDYAPAGPREISYTLSCTVFPASGFLQSVMNFIVFRKVVVNILSGVISDVEKSAGEFAKGNREPLSRYPAFSGPEGSRRIEAFDEVVRRQGRGRSE